MSLEELLALIVTIVGASSAVLIVLYVTRFGRNREEEELQPAPSPKASERWRQRAQRTVSVENAKEAGDELRTLSLEREILSDAIRRLYEANAEGRITEEEREQLAERYKSRIMKVKEAATKSESIVALHELETMQEDLTKLFNERFDELNAKMETLRSRVGLEVEEAIVPTPIPTPAESEEEAPIRRPRKKVARKPQKTRKKAAEERLEKIRAEVEKVLDRLEQMEVET